MPFDFLISWTYYTESEDHAHRLMDRIMDELAYDDIKVTSKVLIGPRDYDDDDGTCEDCGDCRSCHLTGGPCNACGRE